MTINEMKAALAEAHKAATELRALADKKEDRAFTDEERTKFDALIVEAKSLKTQLADAEELLQTVPKTDVEPSKRSAADPMPDKEEGRAKAPAERATILPDNPYINGVVRHFPSDRDGLRAAYVTGQWFLAAMMKRSKAIQWCKDHGVGIDESRAMGESDNVLGGYLVPEEFSSRIILLRDQYGVFRPNCFVFPMSSDTASIGRDTNDLTIYALGEAEAPTITDANIDRINLVARRWGGLTRWSKELDEDAIINIGDMLAGKLSWALAKKEDEIGFIGDGSPTYHGITGIAIKIADGNHTASVFEMGSSDLSWAEITMVDFESVTAILPDYAEAKAKWYISKKGFWLSMARLVDALGGNTLDHAASGPNRFQFLGYPVQFVNVMDSTTGDTASTCKALLGDLSMAATLGDRRGIMLATSHELYFTTEEIALMVTTRYDINVHDIGDTTDAGPIVGLVTPSS